jgi:hypothetical protein
MTLMFRHRERMVKILVIVISTAVLLSLTLPFLVSGR